MELKIKNSANFFDFFSKSIGNNYIRLAEMWYSLNFVVYFLSIDDAYNQRVGFMYNTATMILIAFCYGITFVEIIYNSLFSRIKYTPIKNETKTELT